MSKVERRVYPFHRCDKKMHNGKTNTIKPQTNKRWLKEGKIKTFNYSDYRHTANDYNLGSKRHNIHFNNICIRASCYCQCKKVAKMQKEGRPQSCLGRITWHPSSKNINYGWLPLGRRGPSRCPRACAARSGRWPGPCRSRRCSGQRPSPPPTRLSRPRPCNTVFRLMEISWSNLQQVKSWFGQTIVE